MYRTVIRDVISLVHVGKICAMTVHSSAKYAFVRNQAFYTYNFSKLSKETFFELSCPNSFLVTSVYSLCKLFKVLHFINVF